jgi:hypothetical protein
MKHRAREERQRNDADAVNLQPRREDFGRAEGEEITGPADRTQFFGKLRRDRGHGDLSSSNRTVSARRFIAYSMTGYVA